MVLAKTAAFEYPVLASTLQYRPIHCAGRGEEGVPLPRSAAWLGRARGGAPMRYTRSGASPGPVSASCVHQVNGGAPSDPSSSTTPSTPSLREENGRENEKMWWGRLVDMLRVNRAVLNGGNGEGGQFGS